MRIVDPHVHVNGPADPAEILKHMDANGVERCLLISGPERASLPETRAKLLETKHIFEAAPERLGGLAWLNPTIPGMIGLAEEALEEMGYSGIKIIPDHWYVTDEAVEPFWEALNRLHASILFHTGILYAFDDSSRFCMPIYLEKLLHYPNIRFAMAHVSWPWTEECIAVMGRMRDAAGGSERWQSYVDITPGPPPHIRKQAVGNAVSFCGADRVMFGSDSTVPGDLECQAFCINDYKQIFDELGYDEATQERIFSGTADELFPPRKP